MLNQLYIFIRYLFLLFYIKYNAIFQFSINFSLILICSYILNKNMIYADIFPIISNPIDNPPEMTYCGQNFEYELDLQPLPSLEADNVFCERYLAYYENAQQRGNRPEPLLYVQKDGSVSYTPDSSSSEDSYSDSSSDSHSDFDGNILDRYSPQIIFNAYKICLRNVDDEDILQHSLLFMLTQFPEALIAKTQEELDNNPSLIHEFLQKASIQFKNDDEETSFIIFKACIFSYQKIILINEPDNILAFTAFVNEQLSVQDL